MNIEDIDRLCDLYEQQLKCDRVVSVTEFCVAHELPENPELIDELNRLEFEYSGKLTDSLELFDETRDFEHFNRLNQQRFVDLQPYKKGGLGEVLKATDAELHRTVALKRLRDDHADDLLSQRRFMLEAEITARLEHPGVVPVHGLFQDDTGRTCYAMRMIEGETLSEALRDYHAGEGDPVSFRRLLQSFIQVCQTVAYAHSRGVIHRDLKPQNIILGKFNETIVVDWGLAKVVGRPEEDPVHHPEATLRPVGESSSETQMGSAVGTPAYMSPEQAAGRWDVIDHSSDIYNLGAVLYTLLTGRPPLEGENWPEMQQKIQRGVFPLPHTVKPDAPRALEAVCLKAMSLNPDDRYPSARALATEVERWLADEPVKAYAEPMLVRANRWARRNKFLVTGSLATLVTLITLGVSLWIVQLEKTKADLKEVVAQQMERKSMMSAGQIERANFRHVQFDEMVRNVLEDMTKHLFHDEEFNKEAVQPIRNALISETIAFWTDAIQIHRTGPDYEGWRALVYRRYRAMCNARVGNHERAFDEVTELSEKENLTGQEFLDFARICTVCALSAEADERLKEKYVSSAIAFLQDASAMDYFEEPAAKSGVLSPLEQLQQDEDLDLLRERSDFQNLITENVAGKLSRSQKIEERINN